MKWTIRILLFSLFLYQTCFAVVKENFKECSQSSFCRRLRGIKPDNSNYVLNLKSLQVSDNSVESELWNSAENVKFKLVLTALAGNMFRLYADEISPLHKRYRVENVLNGEPQVERLEVLKRTEDEVIIQFGDNKAVLKAKPFKVEFYKDGTLVAVVNGRGLFTIEHFRTKNVQVDGEENQLQQEDPGAWEENFKSHHDSKPRGPEGISLDITFPGAVRSYGLPQHADRLSLRTTGPGGLDPYRFYNLDVFEYLVDSTMALYGSIPVVYAHSSSNTVGAFWLNPSETWVDINNSKDQNVVSSLVNLVSGQASESRVDVHFMSESGVVDLFILMGPTPKDCAKQYTQLTGVAPLPQYYTLAYHQCRWNYITEDDVTTVVKNFDEHDMPVDTMWLDIEYTDGKKYFTWDPIKFAHPDQMLMNLTSTGRHLVVIIDPHVKREGGYFLHEDSLSNDYYVKTKDGNVYEGWCWPGSSSYPDFFNPTVFDYYKALYSKLKFDNVNNDIMIWNDMNEPSVFNGPEITMPKDCLHHGGWEHRHLHNMYGMVYTAITYEGLLQRNPNRRPFILSRSHFAGTQRYAAIWTGDNNADWNHLAASYPMCLSEALAGVSFCGADIGGFFNNPDVELLQRWYQAAVWLPFFRAHAHIDTRRREPYLFAEDVRHRIRTALRLRYAHLPTWYTLFYEHERFGEPVVRPLFYMYPKDPEVVDIDNQVLVGDSILAHMISESGATTANVYLPGGSSEYWYDMRDWRKYAGNGYTSFSVNLDSIPVFYRGGSIICRKDRPRRASSLMHKDPFTLIIALDSNNSAKGTLYIDDNESFEYRKQKYLYIQFQFKNNELTSSLIDKTDYETLEWIERVIVLGAPSGVQKAVLTSKSLGSVDLETHYSDDALIIRKPGVSVRESFAVKLI
ncbi:neutral alpha-glucosidase AB [Coccinella septempunctata]|uniref:neutral alpha-glucosidase AB n=1 Tax=Coccinella septempunctata TaxID=41139 RepID=UPI001D05DE20|nr:neutral alpha-glucosidase AB [Coccinella septempunctata]